MIVYEGFYTVNTISLKWYNITDAELFFKENNGKLDKSMDCQY